MGKKIGKKNTFQSHFLALEDALSDCNRTNNQSFVNQTKPMEVLHILGNCSIEIENKCNNTLNSTLNATLSIFNGVADKFAQNMKDCSNSSQSTEESCACLEEISMFDVDKVQDCNLNDEKAEAIGFKSACLKAVSLCKTAAVVSAIVIHNCHSNETEPLLAGVRPFSGLVTSIRNWNNVKTISKSEQTVTCCDHATIEKTKEKCGKLKDCESICISKGTSLCPTAICSTDRYDCDPLGGEYKEEPDNEKECDGCDGCPVTKCLSCCYIDECKEKKPKTCALQLVGYSGNVWLYLCHIQT